MIEDLLEAAFSMRSNLRLHNEDQENKEVSLESVVGECSYCVVSEQFVVASG
jgi:hypothetical protein